MQLESNADFISFDLYFVRVSANSADPQSMHLHLDYRAVHVINRLSAMRFDKIRFTHCFALRLPNQRKIKFTFCRFF